MYTRFQNRGGFSRSAWRGLWRGGVVAGALALAGLGGSALAQDLAGPGPGRPTPEQVQQMRERHAQFQALLLADLQDDTQMRLDFLAKKLALTANQQEAWQAFARAVQALPAPPAAPPGPDADAASLARLHATLLGERARHATLVADATAQLQRVLTADQQKTLNHAAQRLMRRHIDGHGGGPKDAPLGGPLGGQRG